MRLTKLPIKWNSETVNVTLFKNKKGSLSVYVVVMMDGLTRRWQYLTCFVFYLMIIEGIKMYWLADLNWLLMDITLKLKIDKDFYDIHQSFSWWPFSWWFELQNYENKDIVLDCGSDVFLHTFYYWHYQLPTILIIWK